MSRLFGPMRQVGIVVLVAVVGVRVAVEASSGAGIATIVIIVAIIVAVRLPPVRRRIKAGWNGLVVLLARALSGLFAWRGITGQLAR